MGSGFVGWAGGTCDGSTSTTCTVSLDGDTTVTATFDFAFEPVGVLDVEALVDVAGAQLRLRFDPPLP